MGVIFQKSNEVNHGVYLSPVHTKNANDYLHSSQQLTYITETSFQHLQDVFLERSLICVSYQMSNRRLEDVFKMFMIENWHLRDVMRLK